MIHKILHDVDAFKKQIAGLKQKSPVYPKIHIEIEGGVIWYSTLVEWDRNGERYSRHHVESCHRPPACLEETWESIKIKTLQRLNDAAIICIEKAIQSVYDDMIETNLHQ